MTRKRFVKLLMSKGYSRDEAQALAEIMNKNKIPYKKAIKLCRKNSFLTPLYCAFAQLASAAIKIAENFKRSVADFGKAGDSGAKN